MISLVAFVVVEAVVLLLGVGFGFDLVLSGTEHGPNWGVLAGCGLGGLVLGVLFAWLALQTFIKPPNMPWVWLYSFGSAWLIGGLSRFLGTDALTRPWQVTAMAATFGTLPGLVVGILLTWARPVSPLPKSPLALATAARPRMIAPPAPLVKLPALDTPLMNRVDLQETLEGQVEGLKDDYPSSRIQILQPGGPGGLAVVFSDLVPAGQVTLYIMCEPTYPYNAPASVGIELQVQGENGPRAIPYDEYLLDHWKAGYGLTEVVRDGLLQVEESLIEL